MKLQETETGDLTSDNNRFAIVAARFNSNIVNDLLKGAIDTLKTHGVAKNNIEVINVPGAYELPLAAMHLLE